MHVMDVNFEKLDDPEERAFFMNLPTSFVLKDEEVDRLREVGGRLLRQSSTYQELLAALNVVSQLQPPVNQKRTTSCEY